VVEFPPKMRHAGRAQGERDTQGVGCGENWWLDPISTAFLPVVREFWRLGGEVYLLGS